MYVYARKMEYKENSFKNIIRPGVGCFYRRYLPIFQLKTNSDFAQSSDNVRSVYFLA